MAENIMHAQPSLREAFEARMNEPAFLVDKGRGTLKPFERPVQVGA
jgi:hypothetical protein